jgi:lincosamide nucleotidyltransferase A/C/D/E
MYVQDVLEIVECLEAAGVQVWLDGGWGVDALIGQQTRDHDDLDVLILLSDADLARRVLVGLGFALIEDESTLCFVARDANDRRVDVHTVTRDADGAALQLQTDGTCWRYPPGSLSGPGCVGGRQVACLSVEAQVLCHLNYEPDEMDRRDMRSLAESRGITLPAPYGP